MRTIIRVGVLSSIAAMLLVSMQIQAAPKVYHSCGVEIVRKGNALTGRIYRASKVFPRARKNRTFEKVMAALSSSMLKINTANKRIGFISASKPDFLSAKISYHVMVQRLGRRGVRIDTFYSVDPLAPAPKKDFKTVFCKIYTAAS